MWARTTMSLRWLALSGRLRQARYPRGLTSMISHSRFTGISSRRTSTKANLICFSPRRTPWLSSGERPTGAFPHPPQFNTSLSSRSCRFFRRSSATSRSRSDCAVGLSGFLRSCWIHRLSVENPTPKSAAPACGKARSSMRPEPLQRGTPGPVVMPCLFSFATRYVFKGAAQLRDRSRLLFFVRLLVWRTG